MNWAAWEQVENVLQKFSVKPIVSVIPDNQDASLNVGPPVQRFWDRVRAWQDRGWSIGLHGYQHLYATPDAGLIGIKPRSEFSGLAYAEQHLKLRCALDVFEGQQVTPRVWVAPGHSFDATTLRALRDLGIGCVSDGFSFFPHLDSNGIMWVPQQLWRLRRAPFGVWTVCYHLNHWRAGDVAGFASQVEEFAGMLTDLPSVVAAYDTRRRSAADVVFSSMYRQILKTRRWLHQRV